MSRLYELADEADTLRSQLEAAEAEIATSEDHAYEWKQRCQKAEARAEAAEAECARLSEDAERYRWLRESPPSTLAVRADSYNGRHNVYLDGESLDEAIDAARTKEQQA